MEFNLREISNDDNLQMAKIIRTTLTELGANKPGFSWQDPEVDNISSAYNKTYSCYYVVEKQGVILGGAGVMSLNNVASTCELQKMYLSPDARGLGLGAMLMSKILDVARGVGYSYCYLKLWLVCIWLINYIKVLAFKNYQHQWEIQVMEAVTAFTFWNYNFIGWCF